MWAKAFCAGCAPTSAVSVDAELQYMVDIILLFLPSTFPKHEKSISILMRLAKQKHQISPKANVGCFESQAVEAAPKLSAVDHSAGAFALVGAVPHWK